MSTIHRPLQMNFVPPLKESLTNGQTFKTTLRWGGVEWGGRGWGGKGVLCVHCLRQH